MSVHAQKTIHLRLPKNVVDSRAKPYWMVQIAIATVVVAVGILAFMLFIPTIRWLLGIALAVVIIIGILSLFIIPRHLFRYHRWEVTDKAFYASAGWLWREWRIAPLSRIQTVDTEHGPLQQIFGLATVTITTASAAGPIKVTGLSKATAAELTEKLTTLTEAVKGDAT